MTSLFINREKDLEEFTTIYNYHVGTDFQYALPTLIIFRVIENLWYYESIHHLEAKKQLLNYRWLLSLSLISKEFFKLTSSLFNRIICTETKKVIQSVKQFKNVVISPHSVLKTINHFTIDLKIFKEFINIANCSAVELSLIFNELLKLKILNKHNQHFQLQYSQAIVQYMVNLESLSLESIVIDNSKVLETLNEMKSLTSLNFRYSKFAKFEFNAHLISISIRKLKLPQSDSYFNYSKELLQLNHLTSIGLGSFDKRVLELIIGKFNNLTSISFLHPRIDEIEIAELYECLLCSQDCRIQHLTVDKASKWVKKLLSNNESIETLDLKSIFSSTYRISKYCSTIKKLLYKRDPFSNDKDYEATDKKPTGYVLVKIKRNANTFTDTRYAKKFYNIKDFNNQSALHFESNYANQMFLYAKKSTFLIN
ncbi:hypothetical protein PPL_12408 [Heterostelium album PN500]|uniref:Uncharacterized protein n=1 Tax=Heterostelium pallidum (strain ATCC 26659 / Pp 5 / PN500) TaxID=670386 RepID=D3BMI8_HETP5|nr:hypothetical protein PPL_12408 [Heterostelium album PN500]EFA77200.1 hypothetical protein PPL_12408 [Heterostelium album PN500]|eukprot:XP_020429329.1 hypothetical protein PPL_12408 [Heterostelium album PN500]